MFITSVTQGLEFFIGTRGKRKWEYKKNRK